MKSYSSLGLILAAFAASPVLAQDAAGAQPVTPEGQPTEEAAPVPPPVDPAAPDATDPVPPAPVTDETPVTEPAPPVPTETATPAAPTTTAPAPAPAPAAPSGLTAEQKAAYDAWPADIRSYFDGLTPARQTIFLRIADADKAKIVAATPEQQAAVWASLEKQDAEQKAAAGPLGQ